MKRRYLPALLLAAAGVLWWSTQPSRDRRADSADAPSQVADAPAKGPVAKPVSRPEETSAANATAEKAVEALDCDAPAGDVARVDGQGIAATDFCAAWRRLSGPVRGGDPAAMDRQGKQLLERMIDSLLVQRALAADGLAVADADVDAALREVIDRRAASKPRSGANGKIVDNASALLEQKREAQGSTVEQLRAELRERLAFDALVAHRAPFEPTEAAIRAAHAQDAARFGTPRIAVVEGYLARAPEGAALQLRERALQLATAFSSAVQDGEAPRDAAGAGLQHMPAFEVSNASSEPQLAAAAFRLSPGAWSAPVQTRAGVVVLRLVQIREGEPRPLAEVRDEVIRKLSSEHSAAARTRIRAELRQAAQIQYLQW